MELAIGRMLIATRKALSRPVPLLVAILSGLVVTNVRIQKEERLLRDTFGKSFEDYSNHISKGENNEKVRG
jgi:protein-S-isoprenylcysteine O-methyltransferase Ste14